MDNIFALANTNTLTKHANREIREVEEHQQHRLTTTTAIARLN